jgi:hypothetical protein
MGAILFAAIISTLHLEGDVAPAGGDYVVLPFAVPAGTVELDVVRTVPTANAILDFGIWSPDGFRGWAGGLTDAATVGVADSSRGYLPGPIAAGNWQLVIGKAKLNNASAHYAADITFRDAATLAPRPRAPFAPTVVKSGARWYKGDLHVHDGESGDARASLDEIVALARARGLDFVVLSDHNTVSQQALIAALQPTLPDLLLMRGIEVTTYGGHGGALGVSAYVDHRIGLDGRTATQMVRDVNAQGAEPDRHAHDAGLGRRALRGGHRRRDPCRADGGGVARARRSAGGADDDGREPPAHRRHRDGRQGRDRGARRRWQRAGALGHPGRRRKAARRRRRCRVATSLHRRRAEGGRPRALAAERWRRSDRRDQPPLARLRAGGGRLRDRRARVGRCAGARPHGRFSRRRAPR